jgi:DNA-binding XRE family transcriptional regulator
MQKWRANLELSQQEMAEQVGVATETISRWEAGGLIQSRAMDNLLRLFFESEEVRRLLRKGFAPNAAAPVNPIEASAGR